MKHTATKFIAMILAMLMVVALAVPMVSATTGEQTASVTYPTYAEANDGDLLYEVDFRGDSKYAPRFMKNENKTDGTGTSTAQVSEDGNSLTLTGTSNNYYGAELQGFDLNSNTVYTITYTVSQPSGPWQGLYVDANANKTDGVNGWGGNNNNVIGYCQYGGQKEYMSPANFAKYGINALNSGTSTPTYTYKVVVDGKNQTMDGYILTAAATDTTPAQWAIVESIKLSDWSITYGKFNSNKLWLVFRLYNGSGNATVVFSDVKVYKGGVIEVDAPGELLLELGDMSQAQTGNYGATYTPTVDQKHTGRTTKLEYSYVDGVHKLSTPDNIGTDTNTTVAYGGHTNLRLGEGQKYTVTYLSKFDAGSGGLGVRYFFDKYDKSHGVYLAANDTVCIANGTATGASSLNGSYVSKDEAKTDGTVYCNDGYAQVAIEIDGYKITVYINDVKHIEYTGTDKGVLSLVMQEYLGSLAVDTDYFSYKNIKVYSGLVMSNNSIEVTDGGVTETVEITGSTYTLPSKTKAGFVFNGWKVNGAEEITAPGTTLTTRHINTLEAVYTEVMSENFFQFRTGEEGKKDIRVLSVIDSLKYEGIGYTVVMKFTVDGEEKTVTETKALKNVYESVTAAYGNGTEVYTLDKLGFDKDGGYFTSFVIKNVPAALGTLTVELTPYQIGVDESDATVGDTVVYSIDLANETVVIE